MILKQIGAYSSGHCPGFTPGSLLRPELRKEVRTTIAATKIKCTGIKNTIVKRNYSPLYERKFFKFMPSKQIADLIRCY